MDTIYSFEPAVDPEWGAGRSFKPRTVKPEFGDGYLQRSVDGINTNPTTLSLTWANLTKAECLAIIGFFDARKGFQAFTYTHADDTVPLTYICEEYSYSHDTSDNYSINATLKQVFVITSVTVTESGFLLLEGDMTDGDDYLLLEGSTGGLLVME